MTLRTSIRCRSKSALAAAAMIAQLPVPASAANPLFETEMVVAKVQLVYSVVGHYCSIADRVNFYDTKGVPAGNSHYIVPFLVCDPLVTLYNPTNATITESKLRIGIWDPPVGFKFKKNGEYLRSEFPNSYLPMARFQIDNESNQSARKSFTLLLQEGGQTTPAPITLAAGESKTFAARVESNWTWGLETAQSYTPRCFYDWLASNNLSNKDARSANLYGLEARPGWDPRAGLQTDHLATNTRPLATRYNFEITNNWNGGWVAIKGSDTFSVEVKPMRAFAQSSVPDFQVGVMAGAIQDTTRDIIREFPMGLGDLPQQAAVSRTYLMNNILQTPFDLTTGGKTCFAVVTMVAKTRALQENRFYAEPAPPTESLYELRFDELVDFSMVDMFGSSDGPQAGFKVSGVERKGNQVFLDLQAAPGVFGLRVMGTDSLEEGFTENLNSETISIPGPPGSGLYKLILDVSNKGPNYYVRIEDDEDG